MTCDKCGAQLTPMIFSWFCAECDKRDAAQTTEVDAEYEKTQLERKRYIRSTIGRIGLTRINAQPLSDEDDDLIDEDPPFDCDEPDYYP